MTVGPHTKTALARDHLRPQSTAIYALGTRLSGTLVSFAGSLLIVALLSPERIGVFLTVSSLTAFSGISDLGLTYSFLLATASRKETEGEEILTAALLALAPIALLSSAILFLAGAWFFDSVDLASNIWFYPWLAYCLLVAPNQLFSLAVTYVEGTGQRDVAWRANFWLELAGGAAFLTTIAMGHELVAFAVGSAVRIGLTALLFQRLFPFRALHVRAASLRSIGRLWRQELWPMQWKNLMNNLSGLLTTRLLTPILFAAQGAASAGRLGFVISITMSMVAFTSAWPSSQSALYSNLFHQGLAQRLLQTFRSTFWRSSLFAFGLFVVVGAACEILRRVSSHMSNQLPAATVMWLILFAPFFAHLSYSFAILIRSRRSDPVVFVNFMLTLPVLLGYWFSARSSEVAFAAMYLATAILFSGVYGGYLPSFIAAARMHEDRRARTAQT